MKYLPVITEKSLNKIKL